jgi:hypothetical protein
VPHPSRGFSREGGDFESRFFGGVHFDFSYNRTPRFLDPHRELPYPDQEREGRLQSAERAVPTFIFIEGYEPSFSLITCGLQACT